MCRLSSFPGSQQLPPRPLRKVESSSEISSEWFGFLGTRRVRRLRLVLAQVLRQLAADGESPLDYSAAGHPSDLGSSARAPTLPLLREALSQVGTGSGNVKCVFDAFCAPHRELGSSMCPPRLVEVSTHSISHFLCPILALLQEIATWTVFTCLNSSTDTRRRQLTAVRKAAAACAQATEDLYAALDARQQLMSDGAWAAMTARDDPLAAAAAVQSEVVVRMMRR